MLRRRGATSKKKQSLPPSLVYRRPPGAQLAPFLLARRKHNILARARRARATVKARLTRIRKCEPAVNMSGYWLYSQSNSPGTSLEPYPFTWGSPSDKSPAWNCSPDDTTCTPPAKSASEICEVQCNGTEKAPDGSRCAKSSDIYHTVCVNTDTKTVLTGHVQGTTCPTGYKWTDDLTTLLGTQHPSLQPVQCNQPVSTCQLSDPQGENYCTSDRVSHGFCNNTLSCKPCKCEKGTSNCVGCNEDDGDCWGIVDGCS